MEKMSSSFISGFQKCLGKIKHTLNFKKYMVYIKIMHLVYEASILSW